MELNLIMVTTLETLLDAGGRVNITDLTERLRISRRTLSYNLSKLNYTLAKDGYAQIVQMDKQLLLDQNGLDQLRGWLSKQPLTDYVLSAQERRLLLLLSAGLMGEHTSVDWLCKWMNVSRNTVLGDLSELKQNLGEYGLTFSRQGRRGYQITGDELTLRYCLYEHACQAETEFISALVDQVFLEAVRLHGSPASDRVSLFVWLESMIQKSEQCIEGKFNNNSITEISYYIMMIICRAGRGMLSLDSEEIRPTREYQMAQSIAGMLKKWNIELPEEERLYLATVLLGAKLYSYHEVARQDKVDLRAFANELIDTFETKACVHFSNREQLIDQFIVHLRPLYYRLRYRVKVRNRIYGAIRREYQGIYDLTRLTVSTFEDRYGLNIPDEELAYISVYLLTWLKRQNLSWGNGDRTVLILCGAGVGTSLLLRQQISEILGIGYQYEIHDVRELPDLKLAMYDLVVTTVDLPTDCDHLIKTDPILSAAQKEQLMKWSFSKPGKNSVQRKVEQVLTAVEAHGGVPDRMGLMIDLYRAFERDNDAEQGPGLWDVLTPDMVRVSMRRFQAVDGLRFACERLEEKGLVEPGYAQSVQEIIEQMGLYAEISPGVLLAHARPSAGVNGVGLALTVFRQPVNFETWGKSITAIFALCTPDNQSHLRLMRDLMKLLDSERIRSILVDCPYQNAERLYRFLRKAFEGKP